MRTIPENRDSFPRTCGGDPGDGAIFMKAFEFSPHLRG